MDDETQFPTAEEHRRHLDRHAQDVRARESAARRFAMAQLGAFLAAVVFVGAGLDQDNTQMMAGGFALLVTFGVLRVLQGRALGLRDEAEARVAAHERHLLRFEGRYDELPAAGAAHAGAEHPYAADLDLVGTASLLQRMDVTHTVGGEGTLIEWLSAPASVEAIAARQAAVRELAGDLELRESLEALATKVQGDARLDPKRFLRFVERAPLLGPALAVLIHVLPLSLLGLSVAFAMGLVPRFVLLGLLGLQSLVALRFAGEATSAFQLVAARRGYVEALRGMLVLVERARFESPLLTSLQQRMHVGERPPSRYMARLDRWAGFAEFHQQVPISFFVNLATLYDLNVLLRLEAWNRDVGPGLEDAFDALAELEALTSLATLAATDPQATFPEVRREAHPLEADGLGHPLLAPDQRVVNDVRFPERGGVLIVTGSNMAGKSTLLRAVGLNIALALSGGPVIARRLVLSPVRLRASMRIDDSLRRGASYFHAELSKLRSVVAEADAQPPVFFLLDELLRGTNARARHLGARAVLQHLLSRGASGLSATHDVALAQLEEELPEQVRNVHFTDVMRGNEMTFDYRLREGVVKTSNALRLLRLAGVEVPDDDRLPEATAIT